MGPLKEENMKGFILRDQDLNKVVQVTKHLLFTEAEPKPKTKVWNVDSKSGSDLGEVKYHGPWRQYCYVIEGIVYSEGCLRDIADFIKEHKKERV